MLWGAGGRQRHHHLLHLLHSWQRGGGALQGGAGQPARWRDCQGGCKGAGPKGWEGGCDWVIHWGREGGGSGGGARGGGVAHRGEGALPWGAGGKGPPTQGQQGAPSSTGPGWGDGSQLGRGKDWQLEASWRCLCAVGVGEAQQQGGRGRGGGCCCSSSCHSSLQHSSRDGAHCCTGAGHCSWGGSQRRGGGTEAEGAAGAWGKAPPTHPHHPIHCTAIEGIQRRDTGRLQAVNAHSWHVHVHCSPQQHSSVHSWQGRPCCIQPPLIPAAHLHCHWAQVAPRGGGRSAAGCSAAGHCERGEPKGPHSVQGIPWAAAAGQSAQRPEGAKRPHGCTQGPREAQQRAASHWASGGGEGQGSCLGGVGEAPPQGGPGEAIECHCHIHWALQSGGGGPAAQHTWGDIGSWQGCPPHAHPPKPAGQGLCVQKGPPLYSHWLPGHARGGKHAGNGHWGVRSEAGSQGGEGRGQELCALQGH